MYACFTLLGLTKFYWHKPDISYTETCQKVYKEKVFVIIMITK